ncbi:MAG: hypothetical protein RR755_08755, partial [Erysipelotrichaceae bacterium]
MKRIKYALIIVFILSVIALLVLQILPKKNSNFYTFSGLKSNERERLIELYSEGKISEGEMFDVKYSYYNSPNDYELFIIKKVNGYVEDLSIRVVSNINDSLVEVMSNFPLNKT